MKFICDYLANGERWRQTLLMATNRMSHIDFRLTYLHLTLTHSDGQGHGYAHYDRKSVANGIKPLSSNKKLHRGFQLTYLAKLCKFNANAMHISTMKSLK